MTVRLFKGRRRVTGKPYAWRMCRARPAQGHLLDLKETVLDPVRRFMEWITEEDLRRGAHLPFRAGRQGGYGGDDKAGAIRAVLDDPNCFKGNAIQQIRARSILSGRR